VIWTNLKSRRETPLAGHSVERILGLAVTRGWRPQGTAAPSDRAAAQWSGSYGGGTIVAADAAALFATLLDALPAVWSWQRPAPESERVATDYMPRDARLCDTWTPGYTNSIVIECCFAPGAAGGHSAALAQLYQVLGLLAPGGAIQVGHPRPSPSCEPLALRVKMRSGVVTEGRIADAGSIQTLRADLAATLIAERRALWADAPKPRKVVAELVQEET